MHSVVVLEQGYAWQGVTYASLSRVAQAITGTKWNDPRFFGLREGTVKGRAPGKAGARTGRAAAAAGAARRGAEARTDASRESAP